jgi:hypothetical protein
MKGSLRVALALVLAAAISLPASAGCCDDFLSCAATVVTSGVSCAIELALEAVSSLIRKVQDNRSATSTAYLGGLEATIVEMKAALARLDQEIRDAMREIDQARNDAEKIFKEDADSIRMKLAETKAHAAIAASGGVKTSSSGVMGSVAKRNIQPVPTQPPAAAQTRSVSAAEMAALTALASDDSLATLRHRIESLKQRKDALSASISKTEAEMVGLQIAAAEAARASLRNDFLKPVDDLLASLIAALRNPLNAPGLVVAAVGLLDGALDGFHSRAEPLADAAAQAADRAVAKKTPSTQEMQKLAEDARKTLAAMRKAQGYRETRDRQAVVRGLGVLPASTPSAISQAARLRSSVTFKTSLAKVSPRFAALKPEFQRLSQVTRTVDVSPFRQRLAGEFDGFFRGKSPADSKKKLSELLAESRRRFASDPKTLAAVEKMLNDEARVRGVS